MQKNLLLRRYPTTGKVETDECIQYQSNALVESFDQVLISFSGDMEPAESTSSITTSGSLERDSIRYIRSLITGALRDFVQLTIPDATDCLKELEDKYEMAQHKIKTKAVFNERIVTKVKTAGFGVKNAGMAIYNAGK